MTKEQIRILKKTLVLTIINARDWQEATKDSFKIILRLYINDDLKYEEYSELDKIIRDIIKAYHE